MAAEALVLGLQVVEASLKGLAAGPRDGLHTPITRRSAGCNGAAPAAEQGSA
jgi:hypothetical protein